MNFFLMLRNFFELAVVGSSIQTGGEVEGHQSV